MLLLTCFPVGAAETAACLSHNPRDPSVPLCPANGSKLLPDSYPAMAVSISDQADSKFVVEFVTKVLKAEPDKPPQFIMNVRPHTWRAVRAAVIQQAGDAKQKQRWLASLTTTAGVVSNWHQDFYQGYIDEGGRPVTRELAHYRSRKDQGELQADRYYRNVSDALQRQCGIKSGDPIFPDSPNYEDGYSGGNIEGGPVGLCVLGDDALDDEHGKFAKKACGGGDVLKAPTRWLEVGHTDEMMATVRTGPGDCDMAILLASPQDGLEAMRADPNGKALQTLYGSRNGKTAAATGYLRRICKAYQERQLTPPSPAGAPAIREEGYFSILVPKAYAGIAIVPIEGSEIAAPPCQQMTNGDFINVIHSHPELGEVNRLVAREMVEFRKKAEAAWQKAAPGCSPKIVEMPSVVGGRLLGRGDETKVRGGSTVFPNISNIQQFGKTLLIPDPQHPSTRRMIEERVKALGLKADFINTNVQHANRGNLHCSTNTIRYCRPRGG